MHPRLTVGAVCLLLTALVSTLPAVGQQSAEVCGDAPWADQQLHRLEAYFTDDEWDGVRAESVRQLPRDTEGSHVTDPDVCARVLKDARNWMRRNTELAEKGGGAPPWSPSSQEWAVFRYGPYVAVEIAIEQSGDMPDFGRDYFFVFDGESLELLGHALV